MKKIQTREDIQEVLPIRHLQVFLAVVGSGSMTLAAKKLNLSQPAISMAVGELEELLNCALVDRSYRPLRATAAGRVLAVRAQKVLNDLNDLKAAVLSSDSAVLPTLSVGLISSATSAGALAIREIQGLAKELRVSSTGLTPELSAALRSGALDVLVTTDPMDDYVGISRHRIVSEPLVIVHPKGMPLDVPLDLDQLSSRLPMVHYTARSRLGAMIDQFMRARGLRVNRQLEFDSSAFFFPLVSAGIGWAFTTPLCILESRMDLNEIGISPVPGGAPLRELFVLTATAGLNDIAGTIARILRAHMASRVPAKFVGEHAWIVDQVNFSTAPGEPPLAENAMC